MINSRFSVLTAFILFVSLGSCGTDDSQGPMNPVPARQGFVSFRIDNVNWEAPATISSSGVLTAYRGNNEILQIQLASDNPGTYNLTASTTPSIRLSQFGGTDYDSFACSPAGGRIIISDNSGTLTGTFSAKVCTSGGGQAKEMLNGVFTKIPFQ